MNNLTQLRNDRRAMRDAVKEPHTWIMSLLYIGTFGSFIGFSFAFGQVLQVQFGWAPRRAADLVWLGPLLGSLIRPAGGVLMLRESRRLAGALIGIAGAIGAYGGALVNFAFRESFLAYQTGNAAYIAFPAFYGLCIAVTWTVYLRPGPRRLPGV
jgi:NNP family nitrate/nitrite transporter-like MFS transporter